ncbi:MAG: DUF2232 domain-containing protein [Thermoleophilia bacterium]
MSGFSTGATSEAGKAIALTVVIGALVGLVPLFGVMLMPVLPLPVAYVTFRRGLRVGAAITFGAGVLSALLTGLGNGMLVLLLTGLVGVVVGRALARKWGFTSLLLAATAGSAAAFAGSSAVAWVLAGLDLAQFQNMFEDSLAAVSQMYDSMGIDPTVITQASEQLREWFDVLPYLLPSILGVAGLMLASATLALVAVVFPHVGERAAADLAFSRFRLHWSASYGFIGGLGLLVLGPSLGLYGEAARLIGLNLFVFFQTLFFIQGLAVVHWLVVTRRPSAGRRAVFYGAALMGQLLMQLTSWAGLLDTWFDYRKRFARAAPKAGSTGQAGSSGAGDQEER